ncbi:hypothetical protein M1E11_14570 [Bacillus sp. JZ8]
MIKNVIGTTLILIGLVISLLNWSYLEPRGREVIPYWILIVCALCGGFIKYYKTNPKNTNGTMNENVMIRKIGKTIDNIVDALTGDHDNEDKGSKNR